jgi:hypothetical protein
MDDQPAAPANVPAVLQVPAAVPATTKVRVLKELKGTPAELRKEALVMTAEVLAYNGPPHVRTMSITSDDEAIMVIAQFVPTAPLQEPVPQPVRDAFKEIAIALGTDGAHTTKPTAALDRPHSLTVETLAEKETRERTLVCGGVKLPKNVDRPYAVLYPHFWLNASYMAWQVMWEEFGGATKSSIPDHCRLKLKSFGVLMDAWFTTIQELKPTAETIPPHLVRSFNALIQLRLEIYLCSGVALAGSATIATASFANSCEERSHGNLVLDYFTDLRKATEAKECRRIFR